MVVIQLLTALLDLLGYRHPSSSNLMRSSATVLRVLFSDCSEARQRLSMILQTDRKKFSLTGILSTISLSISRKLA